ncbi:TIGD4-like protein, partial [Mya arenaria]
TCAEIWKLEKLRGLFEEFPSLLASLIQECVFLHMRSQNQSFVSIFQILGMAVAKTRSFDESLEKTGANVCEDDTSQHVDPFKQISEDTIKQEVLSSLIADDVDIEEQLSEDTWSENYANDKPDFIEVKVEPEAVLYFDNNTSDVDFENFINGDYSSVEAVNCKVVPEDKLNARNAEFSSKVVDKNTNDCENSLTEEPSPTRVFASSSNDLHSLSSKTSCLRERKDSRHHERIASLNGGNRKGIKRKIDTKTIEVKFNAIMEVERGVKTRAQIARELNINSSTVSTWLKNAVAIKQGFRNFNPKRKLMRTGKWGKLEAELIKWLANAHDQTVNSNVLKMKAVQLAGEMGIHDFAASPGWLDRFNDRVTIRLNKNGANFKEDGTSQHVQEDARKINQNREEKIKQNVTSNLVVNVVEGEEQVPKDTFLENTVKGNMDVHEVKIEPEAVIFMDDNTSDMDFENFINGDYSSVEAKDCLSRKCNIHYDREANLSSDRRSSELRSFLTNSGGKSEVTKRRFNTKTIEVKFNALLEVERGVKTKAQIARELNINSSTLSTWLKNTTAIKEGFRNFSPKRKTMKSGKWDELEAELIKWLANTHDQTVNGNVLKMKAVQLADEMGIHDFAASPGWLDRFKDRNSIRFRLERRDAERVAKKKKTDDVAALLKDGYEALVLATNLEETTFLYEGSQRGREFFKETPQLLKFTDFCKGFDERLNKTGANVCEDDTAQHVEEDTRKTIDVQPFKQNSGDTIKEEVISNPNANDVDVEEQLSEDTWNENNVNDKPDFIEVKVEPEAVLYFDNNTSDVDFENFINGDYSSVEAVNCKVLPEHNLNAKSTENSTMVMDKNTNECTNILTEEATPVKCFVSSSKDLDSTNSKRSSGRKRKSSRRYDQEVDLTSDRRRSELRSFLINTGARSTGTKRKCDTKTIEVKFNAILEVEKGVKTKTQIARELNINGSTLSTWLKNTAAIKEGFRNFDPKRKKMRSGKWEELEAELISWLANTDDKTVNGNVLKMKAVQLADEKGISDFTASPGWFDRFKDRNSFRFSVERRNAERVAKKRKTDDD